MSGPLFLFGQMLFELEPQASPRAEAGFPLDQGQYDALKPQDIWLLLDEAIKADPSIAANASPVARRLAYLVHDKMGANAVDVKKDGPRVTARAARVPETALAVLADMGNGGPLPRETIEQTVWSQVGA